MKKAPASLQSTEPEVIDSFPLEYLRLERNLILQGFFTPKNKTNKLAREKSISFTRQNPQGGKPLQVEIRIIAGGNYGLPTVADQDKYLALQSIIQRRLKLGESINPIAFQSVEILRELGITKGGKTNEEVVEWMHRMFVTSVFKTVYETDSKRRGVEEDMRPFRRRVAFGDFLENGDRARTNYVWLDDELLRSFLENRLINFDLQRYLRLKSTIAKAVAIHLHVWMYAARESGTFEKLYGHLCQLLGIENYARLGSGRVHQQLDPPFEELVKLDFLSGASVERARTARDFKIVLRPGRYLLSVNPASTLPGVEHPRLEDGGGKPEEVGLLSLLPDVMKRGIPEPRARRILPIYSGEDELRRQLALTDKMYAARKSEIRSAVGFYIRALEEKWQATPPLQDVQDKPQSGLDANLCPDCGGAGYYYPEGYAKGVKLCTHAKLKRPPK